MRPPFASVLPAEIYGFIAQGVLSIAQMDEAIGKNFFNPRFFDAICIVGTPQAKYKSRFVGKAYKDNVQGLSTYTATVKRSSQRMILDVRAENLETFIIFLRDIIQAYTQTQEEMCRVVFLRRHRLFGFPRKSFSASKRGSTVFLKQACCG